MNTLATGSPKVRSKRLRKELRGDAIFLISISVIVLIAILPSFSGDGASLARMQLVGTMAAVAVSTVGLNLLIGYAGLVSLGQGAFYATGAYFSAWLMLDVHAHPLVAMAGAIAIAGVFGALIALATMRLRGPQIAMVTLVLAVVVERIVSELDLFGRLSGYPNPIQHGSGLLPPIKMFGMTLDPPLFAGTPSDVLPAIMVVVVVVLVLYRNVARSTYGLSLRAIGQSEHLASHVGINVFARKIMTFTVAASTGAIGGVMFTLVYSHLQPESFGINLSIMMVLVVILGGGGTVLGPIVGAVVLVWLQQGEALSTVAQIQQDLLGGKWYLSTPGLVGLLLVLVLYFLPDGITGIVARLISRLRPVANVSRSAEAGVPTPESAEPLKRLPPGEVVLRATGLSKSFGGVHAVDNIDLTVQAGSVHAIIGPNGAGKTTLANVISGVYTPETGQITHNATSIAGHSTFRIARNGIARTFQTPQLFARESAAENVKAGFPDIGLLPLWKAAIKPPSQYRREAELDSLVRKLLGRVGLAADIDTLAGNLSYGKQRALEIARALAADPSVIILDEPAAGLNPAETATLGRLIIDIRNAGIAVVMVEHHMDLVLKVADEVTCMDRGKCLSHGLPKDVLADREVISAYLGIDEDETDEVVGEPPIALGSSEFERP